MTTTKGAERFVIGVDTGGTFTDVTLLDLASGRIATGKTRSTPQDPSLGFRNAIAAMLESTDPGVDPGEVDPGEVVRVLHGTTVATNLILEGKGAPAAVLTNAGFRYVLEIGRNDVPRGASLFAWLKPKRPVPPQHIFEIPGRIGPGGEEVEPLDEAAIRDAVRRIAAAGLAAVAVVFLHSYANPAHERRAAELLTELLPDAAVSLSSDVLPVFREYERSMTTILNVHVKPVVGAYVSRLEQQLAELQIAAPLLLMKSSGGVTSTRTAQQTPVQTALSGPAAGAVGAAFAGAMAGYRDVIGVDIGGTSADITLIRDAQPSQTTRGRIGDWPVGLPMVDIRSIGTGGGSIARVSAAGAMLVGPDSAGAEPGPACYGRGGTEPTVTDAHLVLGHLPPYLLGGSFPLDIEAARRAIATRIAEPLGFDLHAAAHGILAIADHQMVGAIRVVSVERGHDPRDFALLAFGGAGPLHGGTLARLLGMQTIVVPPAPGVLSALGLMISNLKAEFSRTVEYARGRPDLGRIAAAYAELDTQARAWLEGERVPPEAWRITWHAALRYRNQGFELFVPWHSTAVDDASLAATIQAFHDLHRQLYSFAQPEAPVEIITLQVDAAGVFSPPPPAALPEDTSIEAAIVGHVEMVLPEGVRRGPVLDRGLLGAGAELTGPAVVTQLDATTVLLPGQSARVHSLGSLIVTA